MLCTEADRRQYAAGIACIHEFFKLPESQTLGVIGQLPEPLAHGSAGIFQTYLFQTPAA